MLPGRSDGTLRWRMIEVKSSTSVKDYHRDDIAVQSFIAAEAGVPLSLLFSRRPTPNPLKASR